MHSRATDRRSASKCQGKCPDQTLDQAFGLSEVLVAVSTSRLSCKSAGKTRTLMPVWDSSGESRFERSLSCPNAASACSSRQLSTLLSRSAADVGGQVTRSIWSSNKTSAISSDGKSDNSRVIFVFLVRPERLR